MKKLLSGILLGSLCSTALFANEIPYNYIEAGYAQSRFDTNAEGDTIDSLINDIDPGGLYINGSFAMSESFFAFGSYESVSGDGKNSESFSDIDYSVQIDNNLDLDYSMLKVGIGYKYAFSDKSHLNVKLAHLAGEVKVDTVTTYNETFQGQNYSGTFDDSFDYDDDGYGLSLGYRGMLSDNFEVNAQVSYVKFDDSDTIFDIGAVYYFTPQHSVTVSGAFPEDQTDLKIGYRYNF